MYSLQRQRRGWSWQWPDHSPLFSRTVGAALAQLCEGSPYLTHDSHVTYTWPCFPETSCVTTSRVTFNRAYPRTCGMWCLHTFEAEFLTTGFVPSRSELRRFWGQVKNAIDLVPANVCVLSLRFTRPLQFHPRARCRRANTFLYHLVGGHEAVFRPRETMAQYI